MEELEAKLGIRDSDITGRHYVHSRVLRYLGHVFRMDALADRTPSLLQRCLVVTRDGRHCQALPWASLQVKSRSLTILLYKSCLTRSRFWGSSFNDGATR
jgi:hypothetical protein